MQLVSSINKINSQLNVPVVTLSNLSLSFGGQLILDQINMDIKASSRIALCGSNGSGKSTLLKIIAGEKLADSGSVHKKNDLNVVYLAQSGIDHSCFTFEEELKSVFKKEIAIEEKIRKIEEDMSNAKEEAVIQLLLLKYEKLTERIEFNSKSKRNAFQQSVIQGLGFSKSDLKKNISIFSSGWKMRIALAKVLLAEPNLLLLDEPSNYLDLEARQWLEVYLKTYAGAFCLVAHDRSLMDKTCNQIAELHRGKLRIYNSNYSEYLFRRNRELSEAKQLYNKQQEEIEKMEGFIKKFRSNSSKARLVQSRIKQLGRLKRIEKPDLLPTITFQFPRACEGNRIPIQVRGLRVSYGGQTVIEGLNIEINRGEKVALVGGNGVGKSSLLKVLAGIKKPDDGLLNTGANVSIGFYSDDLVELIKGSQTVYEEVESICPMNMIPRLRSLLGAFLFSEDSVFKQVNVLSGGERSRLALIKLLLKPVNLLILDEPTNHLDIGAIQVLTKALEDFLGTLVFVSHDEHFINSLATKILEITPNSSQLYHGNWDYFQWKKGNSKHEKYGKIEKSAKQVTKYHTPSKTRNKKYQRFQRDLLDKLDFLQEQETELQSRLSDPKVYKNGLLVKEIKTLLRENASSQKIVIEDWENIETKNKEEF